MRRIRLQLLLLVFSGLLASHAAGGTIPFGYDYADYAAFAAGETFEPVGILRFTGGYGSGVYLGDGWVLTAAHVAASADEFTFTVGDQLYQGGQPAMPASWDGDTNKGNDIGLLRITGDLPTVTPAALYVGDNDDLLGQVVALSGYGKTGDGVTGSTGTGGSLYAGTNTADALGGDLPAFSAYDERVLLVDFDSPYLSDDGYPWSLSDAGELEYMIATGDSGGGVFLIGDEEAVVVGVNAFVLGFDGYANSDYGDVAGITTVSPHIDWIESVTELLIRDYLPGDTTRDGSVDDDDLSILLSNWTGVGGEGRTWNTGDFNADGAADDDDLSLLLSNWTGPAEMIAGSPGTAVVPEPSSLLLLAGGGVLLWHRGRRRARV